MTPIGAGLMAGIPILSNGAMRKVPIVAALLLAAGCIKAPTSHDLFPCGAGWCTVDDTPVVLPGDGGAGDGGTLDAGTDAGGSCGSGGAACPAGQQCVAGTCRCPAATPDACGTGAGAFCTSFRTDSRNCGACGTVCPAGDLCNGSGVCAASCVTGDIACSGVCTDTQTDSNNCGSCNNVCDPGARCVDGACTCPPGQKDCNGAADCPGGNCGGPSACTNEREDPNHCASCATACTGATPYCTAGVCQANCAGAGNAICGKLCAEVTTDNANCGACGNACDPGASCVSGTCSCPPGQTDCNGAVACAGGNCGGVSACTDEHDDPNHCAACGIACTGSTPYCTAGVCQANCAGAGNEICGGLCVDVKTDIANCGGCDNACDPGATCAAGVCTCPAGQDDCNGTAGCASGHCGGLSACTNEQDDPEHCGSCGHACAPGETCDGTGHCMGSGDAGTDGGVDAGIDGGVDGGGRLDGGISDAGTDGGVDAGVCTIDATWDAGVGTCALGQWANWPMPNPADAGLPNPARYDTSASGIVTDEVTGLVWQQPASATTYTWAAAGRYCAGLTLAGARDWRLPTAIELQSLVDFTVPYSPGPAIDPTAFPGTPASSFWSGTLVVHDSSNAWYTDTSGTFSYTYTTTSYQVRCVRGSAAPPSGPRYDVSDAGTVTDNETGLVWQQALGDDGGMSWSAAATYCMNLSLGDHKGWRVPSVNELSTLVDFTVVPGSGPTIDTTAFPGTPQAWFWTSSPVADNSFAAWFVDFSVGGTDYDPVTNPDQVRCVR